MPHTLRNPHVVHEGVGGAGGGGGGGRGGGKLISYKW